MRRVSIAYELLFLSVGYPIGTFISTLIYFLWALRIIRVKNFSNAMDAMKLRDKINGSLHILGNHPWGGEVFIVPALVAYLYFLFNPLKHFPWCTPKSSLLKFFPFIYLLRALPVYRNSAHKTRMHMEKKAYILHVLKQIVMDFVEGGRTHSKPSEIITKNGKQMRTVKRGYWEVQHNPNYCKEADSSRIIDLPAWTNVYGGWKRWTRFEVIFGTPCLADEMPPEKLQETLFSL